MIVFDEDGHIIIASAIKNKTFKMILTNADEQWEDENIPNFDGSVLGTTFGVVAEHEKSYVVEDENGDIDFDGLKYARSDDPTNKLLLSFKLKGYELENMNIRQQIVVADVEVVEGSENKHFIPAEEIIDFGKKLFGENIATRALESGSSEVINVVITF